MAIEKIIIPDFGDVQKITVVEVFIKPGAMVKEDDSLIALESEKAVMDIPSPFAGVIVEVMVKAEDQVKSGDLIATMETGAGKPAAAAQPAAAESKSETAEPQAAPAPSPVGGRTPERIFHATPSVRALARQKGVDLAKITGTGPLGRILREDLDGGAPSSASNFGLSEPPLEDFSKYGPIEEVALGRIKKISGPHLHRSWIIVPHVSHFDEADITDMEWFRKELNERRGQDEPSYSPLAFVAKALAATLQQYPAFNSSLAPGGEKLILKKYYHIGIAVDTSQGLVVPVVKNVDRLRLSEISHELQRLSSSARAGKLAIPDIQGATFTISSLGSIGGTGFTPIVSHPQVAILGLSRSYQKPVWIGEQFIPRQTLPFSLSYDHRVIDGAEAARFCTTLRGNIEDLKRTLV